MTVTVSTQTLGAASEASAVDKIVLAIVNAPYKRSIDAPILADCLRMVRFDDWIVHVATLFTDVRPELVLSFAERHGISKLKLAEAYLAVKARTGERNLALEAVLAPLASSTPR